MRAFVLVACHKGLQRAHHSHLDNNEGTQKLDKSAEEFWAVWVPVSHVKTDQHIPKRVPRAPGVEIVSQQARGRKVPDKDRKVKECGNKLEGVAQETDG